MQAIRDSTDMLIILLLKFVASNRWLNLTSLQTTSYNEVSIVLFVYLCVWILRVSFRKTLDEDWQVSHTHN